MAETPSTMLPLGTPLPPLRLTDAVASRDLDAAEHARGKKGLLVAFICNHCPFVKHIRKELVRLAHAALDDGFAVLAVNSNDEKAFPQDGPAAMRQLAQEEGWRFPFLFDGTQEIAKSFRAACTPDLFLFDRLGAQILIDSLAGEYFHVDYGSFDSGRHCERGVLHVSRLVAEDRF